MREIQCAIVTRRRKRSVRNAGVRHRAPIVIAISPAGPGALTAVVTGDIDIRTAAHLEAALRDAIDGLRPKSVVIDIAGVAFLDAAGMTALIRTRHDAGPTDIRLTNARPLVVRVLAIAGLLDFLQVSG